MVMTSKFNWTMKRIVKSLLLFAVVAIGLTACKDELAESIHAPKDVVINFVADEASTRTEVDTTGDTPLFSWSENETFAVLEQTDRLVEASSVSYERVDGRAHITAGFSANAGMERYEYVAVYPASGYLSAESINAATITLPATQTMAEVSYDPDADLMVSKVVAVAAQPTTSQMLQFTRLAAVAKLSLKNLALEPGDEVERVIFEVEGKVLAGTITADLTNPHAFTVAEGISSISVATTSAGDVYFTLLPTTIEEGDGYTIAVITNKRLYVKQGTMQEGKSLSFEAGMVTRFGVDMSGITASDKWLLVEDASTLKQGDIVTIAAKSYNYVIGKQGSSYPMASHTEVIKVGNYLYHPVATAETTIDNRIQHYTLLQRDASRVAFDFYNDIDYVDDTAVGFVYATGTNSSPKLQAYSDKNTLFDVAISDGVATLSATDIDKPYRYWRCYPGSDSSSCKFDCTTSVPTDNNQLSLYRLEGAVGTIPTVAVDITLPDTPVVIAKEGAVEAASISEVVFNYVGSWAISVTTDAEWLDVTYDATKNALSYTADANADAEREAIVTITASMEGMEPLSCSFKVVQSGAIKEITIAEFREKGQDVDTTYRLSGRLVAIPNLANDAFILEDTVGNQAKIKYLKSEDGTSVKGSVDLKIGDIVTVTTVVTSSTKGTGGSSTYPSIYEGHYRLTAGVEAVADYRGGSVEIWIERYSNGVIALPEAVEATMVETDIAELAYFGGNSATVTFTSENTTSDVRYVVVTLTYGMCSIEITVEQGVNTANKPGYKLVTDASMLAVGDEVIIVALNSDKALGTLGSEESATAVSCFPAVDVDKSGGAVYDAEELGVMVFTLTEGLSDKYSLQFTHDDVDYYLYTYSNNLRGRKTTDTAHANASFTIAIDAATGAATIKNSASKVVKFGGASEPCFMAASSIGGEDSAIAIYRK